jgi:hypothetical protein
LDKLIGCLSDPAWNWLLLESDYGPLLIAGHFFGYREDLERRFIDCHHQSPFVLLLYAKACLYTIPQAL